MRTQETIRAEITELERLLTKRRGRSGFADNVKAIEEQLATARAELAENGD